MLEDIGGLRRVGDDAGPVQILDVGEHALEGVQLAALVVRWDERTQRRFDLVHRHAPDRHQPGADERRIGRADHEPAVAELVEEDLVGVEWLGGTAPGVCVEEPGKARQLDQLLVGRRRRERGPEFGELGGPGRFRIDGERVGWYRRTCLVQEVEVLGPGVRLDGGSRRRRAHDGGRWRHGRRGTRRGR